MKRKSHKAHATIFVTEPVGPVTIERGQVINDRRWLSEANSVVGHRIAKFRRLLERQNILHIETKTNASEMAEEMEAPCAKIGDLHLKANTPAIKFTYYV